ncbi:MAG: ATP-binding cassette domain-containing protein [Desulfobacterales bacterium]|nr:MAG: ATP-binding cassette domain-containing protein [Desulfobacterales bacterium]
MVNRPFITLDNIAVRLRDRLYLQNTCWQMNTNEHWAILGPNGSGKTTFVKALFGGIPVVRGKVILHFAAKGKDNPAAAAQSIGYVSSELHREIVEREKLRDRCRDFSGKIEEVTTVKNVILDKVDRGGADSSDYAKRLQMTAHRIGIAGLLKRDVKSLSTGEISKVLIAKALIRNPQLLILDEPFEGLNQRTRASLAAMIDGLMQNNLRVILITHRFEEIVPNITHVLFLKHGHIHLSGKKKEALTPETIQAVYESEPEPIANPGAESLPAPALSARRLWLKGIDPRASARANLIEMCDVNVRFGDLRALHNFNWVMQPNENWALCGPDGAGKTTVLKLILGDNLQAYANEIYLFGRRKGSGESIWDIKKQIGFISSELQTRHPKDCRAFDIVCSGFFDTVGLYQRCDSQQIDLVGEWMHILGIATLSDVNFGRLSQGQRQLILIARAMVKSPTLLILDEPCDGLDIVNRQKILKVIELIGRQTDTNLIYVPHSEEELLPCITHVLNMDHGKVLQRGRRGDAGGSRNFS